MIDSFFSPIFYSRSGGNIFDIFPARVGDPHCEYFDDGNYDPTTINFNLNFYGNQSSL